MYPFYSITSAFCLDWAHVLLPNWKRVCFAWRALAYRRMEFPFATLIAWFGSSLSLGFNLESSYTANYWCLCVWLIDGAWWFLGFLLVFGCLFIYMLWDIPHRVLSVSRCWTFCLDRPPHLLRLAAGLAGLCCVHVTPTDLTWLMFLPWSWSLHHHFISPRPSGCLPSHFCWIVHFFIFPWYQRGSKKKEKNGELDLTWYIYYWWTGWNNETEKLG